MVEVHKMILRNTPNFDKEADPHIDSKIKWLKSKYNPISEMCRESDCQWDHVEHKINCERQWYDDWCLGKDKATGQKAEDITEATAYANCQKNTLCAPRIVKMSKSESLTDEKMQEVINELLILGVSPKDISKATEICYRDPAKVHVILGHYTCPTTMQELWDDAITPNKTLHHLIHTWFPQKYVQMKKRTEDAQGRASELLTSLNELRAKQWLVWKKHFDWRIWASLIPIIDEYLLHGYKFDSINTVYYMAPFATMILVCRPCCSMDQMIFRNSISMMNAVGCGITLVGCTFYGYVRHMLSQQAPGTPRTPHTPRGKMEMAPLVNEKLDDKI
ncbi:U-box domain-containing protein 30 [Phtheirospermum japonicum]|uniref:U-box domain-containing protein 30 n=1 Tax=Phtheirospermum japonicum TaxID=374723 RepID=A0A830CB33_9LAMI|nr:U-box domain-containing protein 30 [Phtheirospermum japonicum]